MDHGLLSPRIGQPTILPSRRFANCDKRQARSHFRRPSIPQTILVGECLREPPPFAAPPSTPTALASTNSTSTPARRRCLLHRNGAITTNALTTILRRHRSPQIRHKFPSRLVADGWIPAPGFGLLTGIGTEHMAYTYGKTPALMAQLKLEYIDGHAKRSSPTNFAGRQGPIQQADLLMVSFMTPERRWRASREPFRRTHVMGTRDPRPRNAPPKHLLRIS